MGKRKINFSLVSVSYAPTPERRNYIKNWLQIEADKSDDGFYHSWNLISDCMDEGKSAIILYENNPVGFTAWHEATNHIHIYYMEIKPSYRKNGIGRMLINSVFECFKNRNYFVVELQCSPESSEKFWKCCGFKEYPENSCLASRYPKKLYQIIIPYNEPKTLGFDEDAEIIELWNEDYGLTRNAPKWTWQLEYKDGTNQLLTPIVHAAENDWHFCWRKNKDIYWEGKVKNFNDSEPYLEPYLILEDMPNPNKYSKYNFKF